MHKHERVFARSDCSTVTVCILADSCSRILRLAVDPSEICLWCRNYRYKSAPSFVTVYVLFSVS